MRPPYRHIVRQNEASAINVWDKPLNSSKYQITIKKHDVNHASDILSARDAKATVQPKRQTLVKTPRRQDLVVTPADCLRDHPQRAELSKECNLRVPSISVARLLKHSLAKSGLVLSIDTDMLWEGTYARRIQTPISASIQKLPDDAERKSSWPMIVQGKTEEDRQPYLYISANPSSNEIAEQRDEINVAFWLGILTTDELIRNGGLAAQNQVARQTRRVMAWSYLALVAAGVTQGYYHQDLAPLIVNPMGSEAVAVGLSITDGLLPKDVVRSVQDSMHGEAEQLAYRYKVLEYDYINR